MYPVIATTDGSLTFFSEEFGQAFHNRAGAQEEALEKFVIPCGLKELASTAPEIHLLDVCFGLGYNAGIAITTIWQINPRCRIHLLALERSADVPRQAYKNGVTQSWHPEVDWHQLMVEGSLDHPQIQAKILWGDARSTVLQVPQQWADAVFFDPFSPSVCPELWTVEFFQRMAAVLKSKGRLATYSCSAAARSGMMAAGLQIGSTPPVGRPWPGTLAAWDPLPPLSVMDLEHLQTRAAIPFRDPTLTSDRQEILRRRQQEQQRSVLESTSAWKKRWISHGMLPETP